MFYRKVIQVTALDSPNVRRALEEIKRGLEPSGKTILPGVLSYAEYRHRKATWDIVKQTVGLEARFYKGRQLLLYPPDWLDYSEELARKLRGKARKAEAIGVDPAQGGDDTSICVVDRLGIIDLVSLKTPDTDLIPGMVLGYMRQYNVESDKVMFDLGGGGKQHADRLRAMGYQVQAISFGESLGLEPQHGMTLVDQRIEAREESKTYFNRRAELYGTLSDLINPSGEEGGFAIDEKYRELRRQLAPIPKQYDKEGKLFLPPKDKRNKDSKEITLTQLIGRSPDDADALVLAVHVMLRSEVEVEVGII